WRATPPSRPRFSRATRPTPRRTWTACAGSPTAIARAGAACASRARTAASASSCGCASRRAPPRPRAGPGGRRGGGRARERAGGGEGRRRRDRPRAVTSRLAGLTGLTLETAPVVCHECVWWQSRGSREVDKRRWIEKTEKEWGVWGQLYYDDDNGRLLGSMQY